MSQTIRIHCLTPLQASLISDFLMASDCDAVWMVADGIGPVVVTTAPMDSAIEACRAVGA